MYRLLTGTPTSDHTTLLLNCYTKLKDSSKLNEFINIDDTSGGTSKDPKYHFDVDTAIRVCREAGLLTHAQSLAKQNKKHELYLNILLEEAAQSQKNLRKYQDALRYIERLPFKEADKEMKRIGKTLIENEPKGTTDLIKIICTNFKENRRQYLQSTNTRRKLSEHKDNGRYPGDSDDDEDGDGRANPEEFIHLFVCQPRELKDFLEYLIDTEPSRCSTVVYNTLLEIYMREAFELKSKKRTAEFKVWCHA